MGSASPSVSKGVIRPSILEGAGLARRRRREASGDGRAHDHPVPRRPAARARPFRLLDQDGNEIDPGREGTVALCRCGKSRLRPFCDGSHKVVRFRAPSAPEDGREPGSAER